jgi:hypothetical protein
LYISFNNATLFNDAVSYSYICVGVIEGNVKVGIEVTARRGKRPRELLDDLKERRGYSHLKEEALDRTTWRARFGRGFGPVVRQTTKRMNATFVIVLLFAPFLICFWLHLYFLDILGKFW